MDVPGSTFGQPRNARAVMLLGAAVFAVGAWFMVDAARFVARTVPATGVIVSRGGTSYLVRFEVDGRTFQLESAMPAAKGFARSRIQVGHEVELRYDPDAPGAARVVGSKLWLFPVVMTFLGAVALGSGLWQSRRRARAPRPPPGEAPAHRRPRPPRR